MIKYTINKPTNQDRNKKKRDFYKQHHEYLLYNPQPINEIKQFPEQFFGSLSQLKRSLINYLLWFCNSYQKCMPTQTYLAQKFGVCRQTINESLRDFALWGLIKKRYRHLYSCLYEVSHWFRDTGIRQRLRNILPALNTLVNLSVFMALHANPTHIKQPMVGKKGIENRRHITMPSKGNLSFSSTMASYKVGYRSNNFKIRYKKGQYMNAPYDVSLSAAVLELGKKLNLTLRAMIQLSTFCEAALLSASDNIRFATAIRSPYKWVFSFCKDYHHRENIGYNWDRVKQLTKHYKILPNGPLELKHGEQDADLSFYGNSGLALPAPKAAFATRSTSKPTPPTPSPSRREWTGHTEPNCDGKIMRLPNGEMAKTVNRLSKFMPKQPESITEPDYWKMRSLLGDWFTEKAPVEFLTYVGYCAYIENRRNSFYSERKQDEGYE